MVARRQKLHVFVHDLVRLLNVHQKIALNDEKHGDPVVVLIALHDDLLLRQCKEGHQLLGQNANELVLAGR